MKISITFNGYSFILTPSIVRVLEVKAFKVENAINMFNAGIEALADDIQHIEQLPSVRLRGYVIKYDLSNKNIDFELDEDSWSDYKKYLGKVEGLKSISSKRKEELFANGNISIIKSSNIYNSILSDNVVSEERLSGDILAPPDLENSNPNSPFYNKKVVFMGVLESMSRIDAAIIVKSMGGDINTSISPFTDFVVVGTNPGPSKIRKLESYNAAGADIKILYEYKFLEKIAQK